MPTIRTTDQIQAAVERLAGQGIAAAATHLQRRIKEVISIAPPDLKMVTSKSGRRYWRTKIRATPGAPPRKISGNLRNHVIARRVSDLHWQVGVFDVVYASPLEFTMNHPFLLKTAMAELPNLRRIIGEEVTVNRSL